MGNYQPHFQDLTYPMAFQVGGSKIGSHANESQINYVFQFSLQSFIFSFLYDEFWKCKQNANK